MNASELRLSLLGLSVALHLGVAASFAAIPKEKKRAATAISMREAPRKKPEPPKPAEPPPPPPPPDRSPARPQARAKAAPEAPKAAEAKAAPRSAAPSPLGGAADFGLSMSGGVGSGGMAVPSGRTGGASGEAAALPATQSARKLAPQAQKPAGDGCDEPLVKPRPKSTVQPAYTERAREAKVEGKVRVEISVDEQGRVTQARVVSGLGHGLDEAALAAARQMTFQPASRCGKPAPATFVVSMRFVLGS